MRKLIVVMCAALMCSGIANAATKDAIAIETEERIAADTAEAVARAAADQDESAARLAADRAEEAARVAADSTEASTRTGADVALRDYVQSRSDAFIRQIGDESYARESADVLERERAIAAESLLQASVQNLAQTPSIAGVVTAAGLGTSPSTAPDNLLFMAPPATISVASQSQKILIISGVAIWSAVPDTQLKEHSVCVANERGEMTKLLPPMVLLPPANARLSLSLSAVAANLQPGAYQVGLCGAVRAGETWWEVAHGYTNAILMN